MPPTHAHLTDPTAPIAIIGLGYVGLPLAVEFGKQRPVIGFDINPARITELQAGHDSTRETTPEDLAAAHQLQYSSDPEALRACRIFIVTVPTPVDDAKRPDLTPLLKASETVGQVLRPGDLVIYESTVYPGCTEEDCAPILERTSGLTYANNNPKQAPTNHYPLTTNHFHLGYSPERINPGDHEHRLTTIKKVTSGSSPEIAAIVDALYRQIITAGTHLASSIRVAEAAKVIENTQRDLNIALMNELAVLFDKLGIDTLEVLEAAGSKWNFLPFRPGLVGGHCIGVDPYYLTHKAVTIGYHPEVILAGRRINDRMGAHVAERVVKLMLNQGIDLSHSRVLVLGLAFKENCPDLRNTRVVDIIQALQDDNLSVDVDDPWVDRTEAQQALGIDSLPELPATGIDGAIILAVAHREFIDLGANAIRALGVPNASILYDVKSALQSTPKTWLITGVAGFIGSNLLETLLKLDQRVIGLDNFATGHQRNLDEVQTLVTTAQWQRFRFLEGDICQLADCQRACADTDYVLHQAALGSVPRSIDDPITTNSANIDGFLNMLVAARDAGVKRFVYAASSSTYGDHPGLPKQEAIIGKPLSPYAAIKVVNELYAVVFARIDGFESIGLRYFSTPCRIGPSQSKTRTRPLFRHDPYFADPYFATTPISPGARSDHAGKCRIRQHPQRPDQRDRRRYHLGNRRRPLTLCRVSRRGPLIGGLAFVHQRHLQSSSACAQLQPDLKNRRSHLWS